MGCLLGLSGMFSGHASDLRRAFGSSLHPRRMVARSEWRGTLISAFRNPDWVGMLGFERGFAGF